MRGAGRMNHQRFAVTHIGQMAEEFQCLDESAALGSRTFDVKAEYRARTARTAAQQFLCQCVTGVAFHQRVTDARDQRMLR